MNTLSTLSMTPAALLRFLSLAVQHDLSDDETLIAVRVACGGRGGHAALGDVEEAVTGVLADRVGAVAA